MNDEIDTEDLDTAEVDAGDVLEIEESKPKRKRGRFHVMKWLPWVLVVLTSAAAVTFGILWYDLKTEDDLHDDVRAAATDFVTALTNFSADTIETDAEEIKSYATGDFAEEADVFFGDRAMDAIREAEAESTGEIRSVFIQDASETEASAFVVVSESITNATSTDPQTDILRMNIDLVKTDGEWKISNVEVLESPGIQLPTG